MNVFQPCCLVAVVEPVAGRGAPGTRLDVVAAAASARNARVAAVVAAAVASVAVAALGAAVLDGKLAAPAVAVGILL